MASLEWALTLAAKYHAGQVDKAGVPYVAHICAVVAGVNSVEEKIVAALHDIVEDTPVTFKEIHAHFGDEIGEAVRAITKAKGESYQTYLERVDANPLARAVKIADLKHNSDLSRGIAINPKYAEALRFFAPPPT